MHQLKIGACLAPHEIVDHRNWLFDADRDIELQGFSTHKDLYIDLEDRIAASNEALEGFSGRLGVHGPYEGLDMDNKDLEVRPIITARYLKALEAADRIGARQMVLHSPSAKSADRFRWWTGMQTCTAASLRTATEGGTGTGACGFLP